jgi:type II secretory ATPase GspE/PulE/Tfp pilus assembly ATPase PilB-like protein
LILSRPVALLVKELFLSHSGLVLVCGPTGAGKTTTLYAGLEALWNDSHAVNIVTAVWSPKNWCPESARIAPRKCRPTITR